MLYLRKNQQRSCSKRAAGRVSSKVEPAKEEHKKAVLSRNSARNVSRDIGISQHQQLHRRRTPHRARPLFFLTHTPFPSKTKLATFMTAMTSQVKIAKAAVYHEFAILTT